MLCNFKIFSSDSPVFLNVLTQCFFLFLFLNYELYLLSRKLCDIVTANSRDIYVAAKSSCANTKDSLLSWKHSAKCKSKRAACRCFLGFSCSHVNTPDALCIIGFEQGQVLSSIVCCLGNAVST